MRIVSISMKDDAFEEIERIQKEMGFSGRSELIRQGINSLKEESKSIERLKGHVDCILFIMHEKAEDAFHTMLHKNEDMIKTQIHSNLCNDKCLEIFIIHGSSERIKTIYASLQKSKKIEYIKLIVP